MKHAVDECLYYAVAQLPLNTNWRSPWTQTKDGAEAYARWFVRTWGTVGVAAKALIYYRDGSFVSEARNDLYEMGL